MNNSAPFPPGAQVVAYLRDSGHEDQELSTQQQEARIRAWCIENALVLTQVFTDQAAPGSSVLGREAFLQMIQYLRASGRAESGIILWKFSRFARDFDDAAYYKGDLRRRGYAIHSMNDTVPEGLDGRLFEAAIDWMNARYLADLRADVIRGQRHLVEQHGALGGTPPRGFKRVPVELGAHRDGRPHIVHRWEPDPAEIDRVVTAFEMRAAGHSYRKINQVTNLYRATNAYERFFSNRIYIGQLVFGDQVIEDYCPPVIPLPLWDQVQAVQAKHADAVTRSEDHPRRVLSTFVLSGLARCAQCDSVLYGDVVQFRSTSQHRYEYYACPGQNRNNGCTAKKIPRALLENAVIEKLATIVLDPQVIEARRQQLITDAAQDDTHARAQRRRLSNDLANLRRQIANLTDVITQRGLASGALVDRLVELERQEIELKGRLARFSQEKRPIPTAEQVQAQARYMRDVLAGAEPERLNHLLHALIDRVTVEVQPDGRTVTGILCYYQPPLNASEAPSSASDKDIYAYDLCPGRDISLYHKSSLPLLFLIPQKVRSRF